MIKIGRLRIRLMAGGGWEWSRCQFDDGGWQIIAGKIIVYTLAKQLDIDNQTNS